MFRQGFWAAHPFPTRIGRRAHFRSSGHQQERARLFESLPNVTEQRGLLANLPKMAEDWIDYGGI